MIWCIKTYIIIYVKTQKIRYIIHYDNKAKYIYSLNHHVQTSLHNDDNAMVYLQTNEYDLQAKTYPSIWTHHKLHNNNENKLCLKLARYTVGRKHAPPPLPAYIANQIIHHSNITLAPGRPTDISLNSLFRLTINF